MIDYGNPVLEGAPPIKSLEDLEDMPIPDPYKTACILVTSGLTGR